MIFHTALFLTLRRNYAHLFSHFLHFWIFFSEFMSCLERWKKFSLTCFRNELAANTWFKSLFCFVLCEMRLSLYPELRPWAWCEYCGVMGPESGVALVRARWYVDRYKGRKGWEAVFSMKRCDAVRGGLRGGRERRGKRHSRRCRAERSAVQRTSKPP